MYSTFKHHESISQCGPIDPQTLQAIVNTFGYVPELDHNTLLLLLIFQPICRFPKMKGKLGPLEEGPCYGAKGLAAQNPEKELRESDDLGFWSGVFYNEFLNLVCGHCLSSDNWNSCPRVVDSTTELGGLLW